MVESDENNAKKVRISNDVNKEKLKTSFSISTRDLVYVELVKLLVN